MKEWLKERLSLSAKLSLKRVLVAVVGAGVRAAARVYAFGDYLLGVSVKHGLDLQEAWGVRPERAPATPPPFGAQDFLFLVESARAGQSPTLDPDHPVRASIIIPVFNKVEFTFQCLRSLLREVDLADAEIVVVNNASRDETPRLLKALGGLVRVVENDENLGFVDACNQGAAVARGRFLVFLNNDTVVLPGWLENLLETVEGDASVGAVGSMLIYPDGLIQEAGAGVWRDGEAYRYGWGGSPEDRRYNFAREVDFCSGASLLVRKSLFDQLGGFDRRYAPAYYEDVDLCFGVRSLGHTVVYQPASRVVHYEGATAGRDTGAGFKRFQVVNRAKFVEKWRETLEREQLEKDPRRLLEASNRKRGPSVVVFDERVLTPDRDAGSARMFFILRSLAKWSRPVFVPLTRTHGIEYERLLWKEGVETRSATEYRRLMKSRQFDAAIFSRPDVADAMTGRVRRLDPGVKIIFDMVDAYFVRLTREHEQTGDARAASEARRYREIETRLARSSDLVWCASPTDREVMTREAPGVRIEVVPTIHPLHDRGLPFGERRDLLFIGNLAHRPNEDAAHFLAREIFPLVRERLPGVRLYVVGDNVPAEVAAYGSDEIRVMGYVPDAGPFWRGARVFVAPLRFGAGAKGKVGEALSYGLPVVTTSVGAEGFGLTDGGDVLIRDDPREFASAVVQLYSQEDLWRRLADHGYAHIEKNLTPEVVAETINNSVRGLGGRAQLEG